MSDSEDRQQDIGPNNVVDIGAARKYRRDVGRSAIVPFRDSKQERKVLAGVSRIYPENEPDFSDDEVAELQAALDTLDLALRSQPGHRRNHINKLLTDLGQSYGDRVELAATIRIADFMKSNPTASFAAIRDVIEMQPF